MSLNFLTAESGLFNKLVSSLELGRKLQIPKMSQTWNEEFTSLLHHTRCTIKFSSFIGKILIDMKIHR